MRYTGSIRIRLCRHATVIRSLLRRKGGLSPAIPCILRRQTRANDEPKTYNATHNSLRAGTGVLGVKSAKKMSWAESLAGFSLFKPLAE